MGHSSFINYKKSYEIIIVYFLYKNSFLIIFYVYILFFNI